ncbi:MAG: anthranilate synthase component I family protein [Phycisphaerales bacterium]
MADLDWNFTPDEALAHWPESTPLAALVTGSPDPRWGRLSILAAPDELVEARTAPEIDAALARLETDAWTACLGYELGARFEPRACVRGRVPPDGWPALLLLRSRAQLRYDHATRRWSATPEAAALARALGERVRAGAADARGARIEGLETEIERAQYERMVAQAVERVRAGEVYQANLAQRLRARWSGSARAILRAALAAARPRYGAYLETPTHALVGMSPELFLDLDRATRLATTRPIKGTRAFHVDPARLVASEKDAAELHMIVDLMRNDLGRVCEPASVQVRTARAVESHETVHHGVAEIAGTLRAGTTLAQLLRASFPPGSVTGAPKVQAMRMIDELEPVARGPYCGAVGFVDPARMALNVSIRTIALVRDAPGAESGTLRYSAGCGIVADSDPVEEYEESLHKSAVMLRTAHALERAGAMRA